MVTVSPTTKKVLDFVFGLIGVIGGALVAGSIHIGLGPLDAVIGLFLGYSASDVLAGVDTGTVSIDTLESQATAFLTALNQTGKLTMTQQELSQTVATIISIYQQEQQGQGTTTPTPPPLPTTPKA